MIISVPGVKLRSTLSLGEHLSLPSTSLFSAPSPTLLPNTISSFINISRKTPVLVSHCWALSLPDSSFDRLPSRETPLYEISNIRDPLRVMDSRSFEILGLLREYYQCIPDARTSPEFAVEIQCRLTFDGPAFNVPAVYASLLTFNSSDCYGKIPVFRIPYLKEEDTVTIVLTPVDPSPGLVNVFLETSTEDGRTIRGQLQSISVGIEDLFMKPPKVTNNSLTYYSELFDALWEGCGGSSNIGREAFHLKGGGGAVSINGTRSVKLLECCWEDLVGAVERHLSSFVVCVVGSELVSVVRERGVVRDASWREGSVGGDERVLCLTFGDEGDGEGRVRGTMMGCFHVLVFLPPRFHLLFLMEVSGDSTLVRIRTDRWPCLAYVDDYLEALFSR